MGAQIKGFKSVIVGIILIVMALVGCGNKKEKSEDPLLTSYRLIDEGRYTEAIQLLEKALATQQRHQPYLEAMASAYAAQAGVDVRTIAPVVLEAQKLEELTRNSGNDNTDPRAVDKFIKDVYSLLRQASVAVAVYSTIPNVSSGNLYYLKQAIDILDTLPTPTPTNALYRGVLRIVYLKSMIAVELETKGAELTYSRENPRAQQCQVNINSVKVILMEVGGKLIEILNDISIARPSMEPKLTSIKETVSDVVSDIQFIFETGLTVDDISLLFVSDAILSTGLGNLIQCTADSSQPSQ